MNNRQLLDNKYYFSPYIDDLFTLQNTQHETSINKSQYFRTSEHHTYIS
jgi:hypothetical protein